MLSVIGLSFFCPEAWPRGRVTMREEYTPSMVKLSISHDRQRFKYYFWYWQAGDPVNRPSNVGVPVLFVGHVKVHQIRLEASCLPCSIGHTCRHPDRARNLGCVRQVPPDRRTDHESRNRWPQVSQRAVVAANVVMGEGCQIDSHERDQRAKVQQLGAALI